MKHLTFKISFIGFYEFVLMMKITALAIVPYIFLLTIFIIILQ